MTDPTVPRFAAALARLRGSREWTRYRLAKEAGVTETAVCRMEEGRGNPTLRTLSRLADVLNCTLDELCGRTTTTKENDR